MKPCACAGWCKSALHAATKLVLHASLGQCQAKKCFDHVQNVRYNQSLCLERCCATRYNALHTAVQPDAAFSALLHNQLHDKVQVRTTSSGFETLLLYSTWLYLVALITEVLIHRYTSIAAYRIRLYTVAAFSTRFSNDLQRSVHCCRTNYSLWCTVVQLNTA